MTMQASYPTAQHRGAAEALVEFFGRRAETDAVLLANSCARGKATPDSCLDMKVIVPTDAVADVEAHWEAFAADSSAVAELLCAGRFSELHLDVWDGVIAPGIIEDAG